ncbi:MAG TPA: O-antigen ligase family protein [Terriglobia bacterium]|nr:O-antigen ligase family protein [Terriglobia bacterium]
MLKTLGIESRLQLAITICVLVFVLVTPIESGGAPLVILVYRSLLLAIMILCGIGSRRQDLRISRVYLTLVGLTLFLALISAFRIQGSHFEGLFLWYRLAFFIGGFLTLANYSRYQPARWKGLLLGIVVAGNIVYLIPDLLTNRRPVTSFSYNPNYFATFMVIGVAASLAVAVFGTRPAWRIAAGASAALLLFGTIQTNSRGGVLAAGLVVLIVAIRGGSRIPRPVWMFIALVGLVTIVVASPYLINKFTDRGEGDPYNYARTTIWMDALKVIAQSPTFGVGFGQFINVSKRFAFPVQGAVARYLKRAGIAHSEYLQYFAEIGIPATLLLLSLFGYLIFLAWKRAKTAWPECRCFQEAAILVTAGLAAHALVDNCWTVPVMSSGLVVLSLSDLLPLQEASNAGAGFSRTHRLMPARAGAYSLVLLAVYLHSTVFPAIGLYYNDIGHKAFEKGDIETAERNHLRAVAIRPDQPVFLDNLGMVYLQRSADTKTRDDLPAAAKYFARAIASDPLAINPYIHMETVLIRSFTGNPAQDREVHQLIIENDTKLLEVDPFVPFPRKNLAIAYFELGQHERAFEELHKAIEYEPNYVPAYLQFSAWYRQLGNMHESERYQNQALEIVQKYRNFRPTEAYEGILLGRPEASWASLKTPQ